MYSEQLKNLTLDSSKPTKYRSMAALLVIDDSGHVVNFNQAVADHASMFGINIASSLPLAREVLEAVHGLTLVNTDKSKPVYEGGGGWAGAPVFEGRMGSFSGDGSACETTAQGGEKLILYEVQAKTPHGVKNLYYFK